MYSPEIRERAVRLVFEHEAEYDSQWAAIGSIAAKMGCTAETLRKWVRQAERDEDRRARVTSTERDRLKELERENRELPKSGISTVNPCADGGSASVVTRASCTLH